MLSGRFSPYLCINIGIDNPGMHSNPVDDFSGLLTSSPLFTTAAWMLANSVLAISSDVRGKSLQHRLLTLLPNPPGWPPPSLGSPLPICRLKLGGHWHGNLLTLTPISLAPGSDLPHWWTLGEGSEVVLSSLCSPLIMPRGPLNLPLPVYVHMVRMRH